MMFIHLIYKLTIIALETVQEGSLVGTAPRVVAALFAGRANHRPLIDTLAGGWASVRVVTGTAGIGVGSNCGCGFIGPLEEITPRRILTFLFAAEERPALVGSLLHRHHGGRRFPTLASHTSTATSTATTVVAAIVR